MNQEVPEISVIIPVYNTELYLIRCVESVLSQTFENLEILLVDDGSTDKSGDICDEFAKKEDRIRVFHKENGGSSSARNLGLQQARGTYIGFVDSDDYIEPDMYEKLYAGICQQINDGTKSRIAQIGRDEIDEQGELLPDLCTPVAENTFMEAQDFMRLLLLHQGDCSFCTKLFHRDLFAAKAFPVGALNEDFHLLIEFLCTVNGILLVEGRGYHVFYRMGSNSRKKEACEFSPVFADSVNNAFWVAALVNEHFPRLNEVALRFEIFQCLDYLLHIPIARMQHREPLYDTILRFLRKNWWRGMRNPSLTKKNKVYQTLFCIAPRGIRKIHRRIRK